MIDATATTFLACSTVELLDDKLPKCFILLRLLLLSLATRAL